MALKNITNEIVVNLDNSIMLACTGEGDNYRALWVEKTTGQAWIETNGGPEYYPSLAAAGVALPMEVK